MSRLTAVVLLVALAAAACDQETGAESTTSAVTTTRAVTTTTVDPEQACREVTAQAVDLFERVFDALDGMDPLVFADRTQWPDELLSLDAEGVELDRAVAEHGCDPVAIQTAAFDAVRDRDPEGLLTTWLKDLLVGPGS